jgi:transcriptional regulator with AAA-type ATPase domain/tetratricopeptide (TPR) repeat protein
LLHGETGTGKGLVARIIHDSGPRARGPFLDVNCAAVPEALVETELFGYEAGAFTDARHAKPGLFEASSSGTLFLDEIDALPRPLQGKLLTAIEEKRVRRVGAVVAQAVDVKVIAATQVDLSSYVAAGLFRPDLYHRLAVIVLAMPPLRERGDDVLLLAQQWLRQYAEGHGLVPKRLSRAAEVWLQGYHWPGNVRELSHMMERVTLLSSESIIEPAMLERLGLPRLSTPPNSPPTSAERALPEEASRIAKALGLTGGNVVRADRLLGMSRDAVRYRMRKYGIALPFAQFSPSVAGREPDEGEQHQPASMYALALPFQREPDTAGLVGSDASCLAQSEEPFGLTSGESPASVPSWEQKPVVVLALELTWPMAAAGEAPRYEPWTTTQRWERAILEKVQGFGGALLQRSPSLLLFVFGVPETLEQLPQRAVQAALALRQLVTAIPVGECAPELRQAIHWGQLLVDVEASEPTARLLSVGETLAQPVRLLDRAMPRGITVSSEVSRLVEGWFELRPHEGLPGDAQSDQARAYTVVGYKSPGSLLRMYRQRPLSRFVGRAQELTALENLLVYAESGRGQVVAIVGEPGVGKSRLCYEFIRVHSPHRWLLIETSADSYGQATPYLPVINLLKSYFQIASRDDGSTFRDKVTDKLRMLDQSFELCLPALLTLLGIAVEDSAWQALGPPQRRQRMIEAVKHLLLRESQTQPLCLVVDNLHWIDAETQEFLDSLVDSLPATRILLLVSYRPDYHHRWVSKTYYTQLRLDPLPPASAQELASSILGHEASVMPLAKRLIERAEGNPFFLEECIQTLVETHALSGERGNYRLAKAWQPMQLSVTVHMVLAARIDRLPLAAKRLLQIASVIGHELPVSLLQAVAELPVDVLQHGLDHLQAGEFLYETRSFPKREFTFKHALTHEVTYDSLPHERRRALHARILEAMEQPAGERLAEQVEQLALHALRGEVWEKAVTYGERAGAWAASRGAFRAAAMYYEQAIDALVHLPDTSNSRGLAIDLRLGLAGKVLHLLAEHNREFALLREAEALARACDDRARLAAVLARLANASRARGDHAGALAAGQQALAHATNCGDLALQATARDFLGRGYLAVGDYGRAAELFRRNVAAREPSTGSLNHQFHALAWLARALSELGQFREARRYGEEALHLATHGEEALRLATVEGRGNESMFAHWTLGHLYLAQGDLAAAMRLLDQSLALCRAAEIWNAHGGILGDLAYARALAGRPAEGRTLLEEALRESLRVGTVRNQSLHVVRLSAVCLLDGRGEEAMQHVRQALAQARRRGERGFEAFALCQLGAVHVQADPPEVAQGEARYRAALALAKALSMRPLQAHCHLGLGTLYAKIGRREPAVASLSAATELYLAMDMTFWLPQAKVALAQVE